MEDKQVELEYNNFNINLNIYKASNVHTIDIVEKMKISYENLGLEVQVLPH